MEKRRCIEGNRVAHSSTLICMCECRHLLFKNIIIVLVCMFTNVQKKDISVHFIFFEKYGLIEL